MSNITQNMSVGKSSTATLTSKRRRQVSRVFLVCWLVYSVFWIPYIVREHFPAMTLAEQGTLNVERYLGWTDDIFQGPKRGAFINNNPGASLTGAIPLLVLRPFLAKVDSWNQRQPRPQTPAPDEGEVFGRAVQEGRGVYFLLIAFLTTAAVMAPATAGMLAFFCSRLIEAGVSGASAGLIAILCGIGTPLLFRAAGLNHNLLVADAGFTALLVLWEPNDGPLTFQSTLIAGLLCGYALLCDYSGIVVASIGALYILQRSSGKHNRMRAFAGFSVGMIPGTAILLIYQTWAFGGLFHLSQQYMPATAQTVHGYRGFDWPSPALAWALLVDPRFGLFAYCPALVLAFAAPFVRQIRYKLPRRETRLLLIYFGLFLLFCAANRYSWLQPLTGFRYLLPVAPGLALLAVQAAQALPRPVRRVLAGISCIQMLVVTAAHENDLRLTLHTLRERHFEPFWLIRLRQAGTPGTWIHASEWLAAIALGVALYNVLVLLREAAKPSGPHEAQSA
ncbi:MAG TPA: hypothetical protein VHY84_23655 [Bryobacteraceae bacterium]|nr:hypothetical protein [Bryobacteraceae bacterium]